MKIPVNVSIRTASAIAIVALVVSAGNVTAADCKGLAQAKCEGNTSCSWVDSYKRKDGKKVDAYCRSKGKKKSAKKSEPKPEKESDRK